MVIIDQPVIDGQPVEIVESIENSEEYSWCPSGLQGLDIKPQFMVKSNYIVGYVDKKNAKVVLNPQYYDYEKLSEQMQKKRHSQSLGKQVAVEMDDATISAVEQQNIEQLEQENERENA